jgi:hypothetical protein
MKHSNIAGVLGLILMMALVLPAAAAEQRPFRGMLTGAAAGAEPRCGDSGLTLGFVISGVASHLGRFTGSGTNCTEPTLGTSAVGIWDGIVVLEAADGSTLTLSYDGTQAAPVAGAAAYAHTDTVVSGTGRFANATGELAVTGSVDFGAPQVTITGTVSGWLDY